MAVRDVFNRSTTFGGALSADGTRVLFDEFTAGFLAQQLGLGYQQRVSRIYELAGDTQYFVVGRPEGQLTMGKVVGPKGASEAFIYKFGDACKAENNTIQLQGQAGCGATAAAVSQFKYTAFNVILQNVGMNVRAEDMLIQQQFAMMFVGLEAA